MRRFSIFFMIGWGLSLGLRAQLPDMKDIVFRRLHAVLNDLYLREDFSGVVIVKWQGEELYRHAWGFADRRNKIPLTVDSPFMIASCSKSFTAAAVMKLWEDGKLRLDDHLLDHLSEYPVWQGRRITLEQCLNHTSGIPCYMNDRFWEYYAERMLGWKPTPEKLIRRFSHDALKFKPGRKYSYSNSGYTVLARIIERQTGMPYEAYVKKEFLDPLGLDSTRYLSLQDRHVPVHAYRAGVKLKNLPIEMAYGMGALTSTAPDLMRWLESFADSTRLMGATIRRMMDPGKHEYGFGWESEPQDELNRFRIFHGGYFPGWNSVMSWFPEEDLKVVVLSNQDEASPYEIVDIVARIVFNQAWPEAQVMTPREELELPGRGVFRFAFRGDSLPAEFTSRVELNGTSLRAVLTWDEMRYQAFERINPEQWIDKDNGWWLEIGENELVLFNAQQEWRFEREN